MTKSLAHFRLQKSQRDILRTIWSEGPIARVEIGKQTGLGSATVTRLCRDLVSRKLIAESVLRSGQRGQPIRPLVLAPDGAFALGVYFSHSYLDIGLIDFAGKIVGQERLYVEEASPKLIARASRIGLSRLTAAAGVDIARVVGVGVAVPGDFDATGRKLKAHSYFPSLWDFDIAGAFQKDLPVPVFVENDGAAAAAGERLNGVGRNLSSFAFIHIGHGLGGGLVLNGRLFRGRNGNSGLMGVLFPTDNPRPSGQDLLENLQKRGLSVKDFNDLESDAVLNNPATRAWLKRASSQLGYAISVAGRILDPDAVVVGGRLPPAVLTALFERIDVESAFTASHSLPSPKVLRSELGPDAGVIGAASVCMFKTFFEP